MWYLILALVCIVLLVYGPWLAGKCRERDGE